MRHIVIEGERVELAVGLRRLADQLDEVRRQAGVLEGHATSMTDEVVAIPVTAEVDAVIQTFATALAMLAGMTIQLQPGMQAMLTKTRRDLRDPGFQEQRFLTGHPLPMTETDRCDEPR